MEGLDGIARLAVAQAVYKAVAEEVSTKDPDSLRGRCDARLIEAYRSQGVKSVDLRVNGEKVGTYTVSLSKPKPARRKAVIEVDDLDALSAFAKDNSGELRDFMGAWGHDYAQFCIDMYGIVPDGCRAVVEETPAVEEEVKGTTLRVDARKVAEALHGTLPARVLGLMEGAE